MPSHYNMRMLPPKGSLEKPQSSRFAIGAPTVNAGQSIAPGNDIQQTAQAGGIGSETPSTPAENLTVTQKKMIAFLAGVVVGLLVNRRK